MQNDFKRLKRNEEMKQYHELLKRILNEGTQKGDRTGTGTLSVFGHQMRFDLSKGFPLVTTKKVHWKSVVHELLWFLKGDTNIKYLNDNGVRIWDSWRKPYTLDREIVFIKPKKVKVDNNGYNGDYSTYGMGLSFNTIDYKLACTWKKMMRRCYDVKAHNYSMYGGNGVFVHKDWHNPSNFINDVKNIPHWYYKKNDWNNFELDKDYFGSNIYSKESCVWLRNDENNFYTKKSKPLKITDSEGKEYVFITTNMGARFFNISNGSISRFTKYGLPKKLKGKNKRFNGYSFQAIKSNKLIRLKLIDDGELGSVYGKQWRSWGGKLGSTIDQISDVIEQIKTNPNSRRLIVSAWNVGELHEMALPPCHLLFQFYVNDGKLSCQLYQRSADVFLGVPFNIASYSLLIHLVANECNLEVGEFIHTIGDAHIYNNHIEQVKLQLSRDFYELPDISIRNNVKVLDAVFDDIKLINYKSHPSIKGKVAV